MTPLKPYSKPYYTDQTQRLKVVVIPCRSDNYTFLILSPDGKEAFMVDCADHVKTLEVIKNLNLSLSAVLLTHHHYDHVDGLDVIFEKHPKANFYCTETDQNRNVFKTKGKWVTDGDQIEIFGEKAQVLFTPGHTTSHVSYLLNDSNALFSGDLIFSLGCGRVFEPYEKVFKDFFESFEKIKSLSNDDTLIFCAHEYTQKNLEFHESIKKVSHKTLSELQKRLEGFFQERSVPTNMGYEKRHNAFINCKNFKDFEELRALKDQF